MRIFARAGFWWKSRVRPPKKMLGHYLGGGPNEWHRLGTANWCAVARLARTLRTFLLIGLRVQPEKKAA